MGETAFTVGDRVVFQQNAEVELLGTITRVWDKPKANPYVTIKTGGGSTFVRDHREVLPWMGPVIYPAAAGDGWQPIAPGIWEDGDGTQLQDMDAGAGR